jgi:hypothetical protein
MGYRLPVIGEVRIRRAREVSVSRWSGIVA